MLDHVFEDGLGEDISEIEEAVNKLVAWTVKKLAWLEYYLLSKSYLRVPYELRRRVYKLVILKEFISFLDIKVQYDI